MIKFEESLFSFNESVFGIRVAVKVYCFCSDAFISYLQKDIEQILLKLTRDSPTTENGISSQEHYNYARTQTLRK